MVLNFKVAFGITLTFFLCGCIVQSSQLNNFIELVKEPSMDLLDNRWSVRYSNYESIVYPVSTSNGILFSNREGDQVFFDGWNIRKIRGMGNYQLSININIDEINGMRFFHKGNRLLSKHQCDQWEALRNSGLVRYHQYCSGERSYRNSILLEEEDVSMIRQIIDERYTVLTLTKLK